MNGVTMLRDRPCPKAGPITIRAARADDRERLVRAFGALEPESVYKRFFFPKKGVDDDELRRLTEPDGGSDIVLVATVGSGDDETIVGIGHCVRTGPGADIAFLVEEDWHGRGIAGTLLQRLAGIARERGITCFEADVLADNAAMLKVFRRSALPMDESRAGAIVHLCLSLTAGDGDGRAT